MVFWGFSGHSVFSWSLRRDSLSGLFSSLPHSTALLSLCRKVEISRFTVAGMYLVLTFSLSMLIQWMERRMGVGER